jgi:hypothetical protein
VYLLGTSLDDRSVAVSASSNITRRQTVAVGSRKLSRQAHDEQRVSGLASR